jgi:50S ribosomal protein L16 3-hydroxylase
MGIAVPFVRENFDLETFFSTYWRKQPLFVPGGAAALIDGSWSEAEFQAALAAARSEDAAAVKERAGDVVFVEKVSRFDQRLRGLIAGLAEVFGAPRTWFDAIRTYSASGIGAHFDHSDNFVLQQSGVKEWSLSAPRHIAKADIARRMMNLPGVGAHELPEDDHLTFTVTPGDLLYIPLFWLHSGVSHADSLSVSLVCPALSLQSAVLPALTRVVRSQALGHQPLPAYHAGLTAEQKAKAAAAVAAATRAMLRRMSDDDLVAAVLAAQSEEFSRR